MSQGQANTSYSITSSSKSSLIFAGDYAAADEGSFYTCTQANTAGTAVATTTQVLGAANPVLAIMNGWPVGPNSYNIYLRYIKVGLIVVSGSAANTSVNYVMTLDPMQAKLTTITTVLVPQNVNTTSGVLSKAQIYGGVLVAAAQSAQGRLVGAGQVSGAIQIAFDEWIFHFGDPSQDGSMVGTQSLVKRIGVGVNPIIIGPQTWFTLGVWGASWAAFANNYAIEIGYVERPIGQ